MKYILQSQFSLTDTMVGMALPDPTSTHNDFRRFLSVFTRKQTSVVDTSDSS